MADATLSDNIFSKCATAFSTNISQCGAVSLCNISPTTSDELESIYKDGSGRWRIIGALLEADFMGKACQSDQYSLYDWIMATKRELGSKQLQPKQINAGLYEVWPFVKMGRKQPINNIYWTVSSGDDTDGTIDGDAYGYSCVVESQTGIPADVRWFPARMIVFINGKTDGGTATRTAWYVVNAAEIGSNQVRLYLNSQNANTHLDAAKVGVPVTGYLTRGTPNVSDYEKYCPQIPGLNTTQLVPFFYETTRWSLCEDDITSKFIQAIRDNNPLYKQFINVESVEVNRQVMADFQRRHAESFFWQKPLANQTLTAWENLESINVYSDDSEGNYLYNPFEGRCIARRANATGIYEQHAECGMVKDLQGQKLNLPELFRGLYKIIRIRQANGIPLKNEGYGPIIELTMDSFYASQFAHAMTKYFSYKSEGLLRLNQDLSAKINAGPMGWFYQRFKLDYPNCEIRILTHPAFDDMVDAAKKVSDSMATAGRYVWILDWSSNYQAIIASNSVTNRSGDINRMAEISENHMCVMKVPRKTVKMNSLTYTNVVECPQASLLLENMSDEIPEEIDVSGSTTDYYGDYSA